MPTVRPQTPAPLTQATAPRSPHRSRLSAAPKSRCPLSPATRTSRLLRQSARLQQPSRLAISGSAPRWAQACRQTPGLACHDTKCHHPNRAMTPQTPGWLLHRQPGQPIPPRPGRNHRWRGGSADSHSAPPRTDSDEYRRPPSGIRHCPRNVQPTQPSRCSGRRCLPDLAHSTR